MLATSRHLPIRAAVAHARHRSCFALSTWFRIEEQGMEDYELLSRASAFLVRPSSASDDAAAPCYAVAPGHSVFPPRFPQYYPPPDFDWLSFVEPKHVFTQLEVRSEEDGELMASVKCGPAQLHESRDLALLRFEMPDHEALEELRVGGGGADVEILPLDTASDENTDTGRRRAFLGHTLNAPADDPSCRPKPALIFGAALGTTEHQCFASSEEVLEMGMCGGPVLNQHKRCVGVTEGVVPEGGVGPAELQNAAVYISASVIAEFLAAEESKRIREETS